MDVTLARIGFAHSHQPRIGRGYRGERLKGDERWWRERVCVSVCERERERGGGEGGEGGGRGREREGKGEGKDRRR